MEKLPNVLIGDEACPLKPYVGKHLTPEINA
jgi:hypothetical protein